MVRSVWSIGPGIAAALSLACAWPVRAQPACPSAGVRPVALTSIGSRDGIGAADNARPTQTFGTEWDGAGSIARIRVSGRLWSLSPDTFASEARVRFFFGGVACDLQPFSLGAFTGYVDVLDYVATLPAPQPATSLTAVEFYESYDDVPGNDALWENVCITLESAAPTALYLSPSVTGLGPATSPFLSGDMVRINARVTPGEFPASENIVVTTDLTTLGGSSTQQLVDDGTNGDPVAGDRIYSRTLLVPEVPAGDINLEVRASDSQGRSVSEPATLSVATRGHAGAPAVFTDLRDLSCGTEVTRVGLAANQIRWFKVRLPATPTGAHSSAWVDIHTIAVSSAPNANTGLTLFDASGNLVASDADDGPSSLSELSFGQTSPLHPTGPVGGVGANGRDGVLDGGVYWLAAALTDMTPSASNWRFRTGNSPAGEFDLSIAPVASTCPTPVFIAASIDPPIAPAGSSVHLSAVVTRGVNPASTFTAAISGVRLDATGVGGEIVRLYDDGLHGDGAPFDNTWGADMVVPAVEAEGVSLIFNVIDDQGRSASKIAPFSVATCGRWTPIGSPGGTNGLVHATVTWDPDGPGQALPVQVVGGSFTQAGRASNVNNIATWDGVRWSGLGSGFNGTVHALLATPAGELYAAGAFTASGGTSLSRVARWNGVEWAPIGLGFDGDVYALSRISNDDLVAGGAFLASGGTTLSRVARWSGSVWTPIGDGFDGDVRALLPVGNGELVAGGSFRNSAQTQLEYVAKWDGVQWQSLGTGIAGNSVLALAMLPTGDIVAAGRFHSAGEQDARMVARWNGTQWVPLPNGPGGTSIDALAVDSLGTLYAGGSFSFGSPTPSPNIARYVGGVWQSVGTGTSAPVRCLAIAPNGGVYAGGEMSRAGEAWVHYITRWTGSAWLALGGGPTETVETVIRAANGDIVVGGRFVTVDGVEANRVARWNGTNWSALGPGLNGPVTDVAELSNGHIVAAGEFTQAGQLTVNGLARWDGATWHGMGGVGPTTNSFVRCLLVMPNGDLIAGGSFLTIGGAPIAHIARWNGATWSPLGLALQAPSPGPVVHALALTPSGELLMGGRFDRIGNVVCNGVARWNGSAWQPIGSGMLGSGSIVYAILAGPGNRIVVGGASPQIAEWNGSVWSGIGYGLDGFGGVFCLARLDNGDLVAGGTFTRAEGRPASCLASWNEAHWAPLGGGVEGYVYSMTSMPDGGLMAAGDFNSVGGRPAQRLARWIGGVPPSILESPSDRRAAPGSTVEFAVDTAEWGLSYRWRRDGLTLSDGPREGGATVSGASTAELILVRVTDADTGSYTCLVSNQCGGVASSPAQLVVGCPADLDGSAGQGEPDGAVTIEDLLFFIAAFEEGASQADLDDDGQDPGSPDGAVTVDDLLFFLGHFEVGC